MLSARPTSKRTALATAYLTAWALTMSNRAIGPAQNPSGNTNFLTAWNVWSKRSKTARAWFFGQRATKAGTERTTLKWYGQQKSVTVHACSTPKTLPERARYTTPTFIPKCIFRCNGLKNLRTTAPLICPFFFANTLMQWETDRETFGTTTNCLTVIPNLSAAVSGNGRIT